MKRHFPLTRYALENDLHTQIEHFKSECEEVVERINNGDFLGIIEEAMDLIHSAESFLYIAEKKHGFDVDEKKKEVVKKNQERGYYVYKKGGNANV